MVAGPWNARGSGEVYPVAASHGSRNIPRPAGTADDDARSTSCHSAASAGGVDVAVVAVVTEQQIRFTNADI